MNREEYKRQNEQRDKKKDAKAFCNRWFGWWKTPSDRFAALIALFTAVLAGVAYFQLSAMRSTDEATHTLAKAALKQASAALMQAEAAANAQRPYMSYSMRLLQSDNPPIDIPAKSIPENSLLDVQFENLAEGPALVFDVHLEYKVLPRFPDGCIKAVEKHDRLPRRAVLTRGKPLSIQRHDYRVKIDEDDRIAIEKGEKSLFVYGNFRFNNNVASDYREEGHDFFIARKYIFRPREGERVGFTHYDIGNCYSR